MSILEVVQTPAPLTKPELARLIRDSLPTHFHDHGAAGFGAAIYTLADPRDLCRPRYVGQTRNPRRRFLQHLNCARLWMPDETPWWIANPRHRPLYEWIRALHRDGYRLPVMIVSHWVQSGSCARNAERTLIRDCMQRDKTLLNVEAFAAGPQMPLL